MTRHAGTARVARMGVGWAQRSRHALWLGVLLVLVASACRKSGAQFDMELARRKSDLDAEDLAGSARIEDGVHVREVKFSSRRWDGEPSTIRIQAYVAVPPGQYPRHSKPAVIYAHGLGGQADRSTVIELCRNLDVVAVSLSGPGLGTSQGSALLPTEPGLLFVGHDDIRHNWLYTYVFAILRTITFAQTLPEVDPQAIALTGFSLGGIATLIANGVDDRIAGALPVAASGSLQAAAEQDTWLRQMIVSATLQRAARSAAQPLPDPLKDPGVQALFQKLDPLRFAKKQHGTVYLLMGAQDEYFPLQQTLDTFRALRGRHKRLALVPDYDHGWYFGSGCPARCMPSSSTRPTDAGSSCPAPPICPATCPADAHSPHCGPQHSYNRQAEFAARWALLLRALIAQHVARPPRPFPAAPTMPTIYVQANEVLVSSAAATVAARLAISTDCGYTFSQHELARMPDGSYRFPQPAPQGALLIAEVEGPEGAVSTAISQQSSTTACPPRFRPFGPRPASEAQSGP